MSNPINFSWTGATERVDGTPYLPVDRKGYNASMRPINEAASSPDNFIVFSPISETQDFVFPVMQLANLPTDGDWLFTVQEVDKQNRLSDWATEISFTWVTANPKPPTLLSAV